VPRARARRCDLQPACGGPAHWDPGHAARPGGPLLHSRVHGRMRAGRRAASVVAGGRLRVCGRPARFLAGRPARLVLRPARARLACLCRALRARGALRGATHPRVDSPLGSDCGSGLHPRAWNTGDACHPFLRQSQRAPIAAAWAGEHGCTNSGLPCRPRALAIALPRLRSPLFRPESQVRVGLTTTKETRCPSTSCCRA
jgi:hypothetical protein